MSPFELELNSLFQPEGQEGGVPGQGQAPAQEGQQQDQGQQEIHEARETDAQDWVEFNGFRVPAARFQEIVQVSEAISQDPDWWSRVQDMTSGRARLVYPEQGQGQAAQVPAAQVPAAQVPAAQVQVAGGQGVEGAAGPSGEVQQLRAQVAAVAAAQNQERQQRLLSAISEAEAEFAQQYSLPPDAMAEVRNHAIRSYYVENRTRALGNTVTPKTIVMSALEMAMRDRNPGAVSRIQSQKSQLGRVGMAGAGRVSAPVAQSYQEHQNELDREIAALFAG